MNKYLLRCAGVALVVATSISTAAQQPLPAPPAPTIAAPSPVAMTNDDVLKMARGGLSEALIVTSIRQAKQRAFVLTPDALLQLKAAGVSESILTVMIDPSSDVPVTAPLPSESKSLDAVDDPSAPHEPGIYVDLGKGQPNLTMLEPAVFSEARSGGVFTSRLTYGIVKAKWKAVVRGTKASQRIARLQPTFYFYFEQKGAGLSYTGGGAGWLTGASSPNEFVLARMTQKGGGRELIVGQWSEWGSSSGARSKDTVNLQVERLAPGIYKASPAEPLEHGSEYCFFYAGSAAAAPMIGMPSMAATNVGKLFDFGVDATDVVRVQQTR